MTEQQHTGNFGYAYGLVFHYGETDGLEREFVNHNNTVRIDQNIKEIGKIVESVDNREF